LRGAFGIALIASVQATGGVGEAGYFTTPRSRQRRAGNFKVADNVLPLTEYLPRLRFPR
jgi:hypothetical protein